MDTRLFLIPIAIFVIAIVIMISLNIRSKHLKPETVMQEIRRFVGEQLPQLQNTAYKTISCFWNSEHQMLIVYHDSGLYFIPVILNIATMKLKRYEDNGGASLKKQVIHEISAGNATEEIDFVPLGAIVGVEVNEKKKEVKIALKSKTITCKCLKKGFFGIDQTREIEEFIGFIKGVRS